jgi:ketosteroid isomerase-like protein
VKLGDGSELQTTAAGGTMERDIELLRRMYTDYFEAFRSKDPHKIVPYYHTPCMFLTARSLATLLTTEELVAEFGRIMGELGRRGYERTQIRSLDIKLLSEELAVVAIQGTRYRKDNEVLESLGAVYTLRKLDSSWKIVLTTVHDPNIRVRFS